MESFSKPRPRRVKIMVERARDYYASRIASQYQRPVRTGTNLSDILPPQGQCPASCRKELLDSSERVRGSFDSSQGPIHRVDTEGRRIEVAPDPVEHLGVLRVVRVSDRLEEFLVARDAAAILGRAAPFASQTNGVPARRLGSQEFFNEYLVFPMVAKVVHVAEPPVLPRRHLTERHRPLRDGVRSQFVDVWFTVTPASDDKFVEVAGRPSHRHL